MIDAPVDGRLDEVLRALADTVRRLRHERELTVTALSFEAGISESRVRAIESGRTTASLPTLVALAETFGIDLAELFGDAARDRPDAEPASPYVVPSEVVWGGELPPAPWMPRGSTPPPSPYVVPSEVVWGGELPPAPWTTARVATPISEPPSPSAPSPSAPSTPRTETTWGAPLPPASWMTDVRVHEDTTESRPVVPPSIVTDVRSDREAPSSSATPQAHDGAGRGGESLSRYVRVGHEETVSRQPRTFSDLREGVLAGREFRSLREFAVAAVAEADYDVVTVARIFRLPVWKLERWVAEAGYIGRA